MNSETKFLIAAGLLVAAVATADVTVGKWIFKTNSAELPAGYTLKADNMVTTAGATPPGMVPIGGMVAVMSSTSGAWAPPASGQCKDGFARADGVSFSGHATCTGAVITATPPDMTGGVYPKGVTVAVGTGTRSASSTIATPAHYHSRASAGATLANVASTVTGTVGGTDGTHAHAISDPGHGHSTGYTYLSSNKPGTGAGAVGTYYAVDSGVVSAFTGISVTASASSGHSHAFSLTAPAQTISGTIGLVTGGSSGDAPITSTGEPANVTVVWVIRVK